MNRKVVGVVLGVILVLSSLLIFSVLTNYSDDDDYIEKQSDADPDEMGDEIDNNFLEEDDEIEIGEMV